MAAAILKIVCGVAMLAIWGAFFAAAMGGDRGAGLFAFIGFFPMVIPGLDFIWEGVTEIYWKP